LPLGTYQPEREVMIKEDQGILMIFDIETGCKLASHKISLDKGRLISNNNHLRDHSARIAEIYQDTLANMGGSEIAAAFLDGIHREKPRYIRDQYNLVIRTITNYSAEIISQALDYCVQRSIFSAVEFKTALEYFAQQKNSSPVEPVLDISAIPLAYRIKTEVRNIGEYAAIYGGMSIEQGRRNQNLLKEP
jgi:hypothetical protein